MSTFYPENIPQEMKDIPQWILWKLEKRGKNLTKVPYHVNGKKADTTKYESWTTYERVFTVYESSHLCRIRVCFDQRNRTRSNLFGSCVA